MDILAGAGLVGIIAIALGFFTITGIHKISEGHVGVYYRGGKLLNYITYPGYNTMNPYLTTYEEIQVTQ